MACCSVGTHVAYYIRKSKRNLMKSENNSIDDVKLAGILKRVTSKRDQTGGLGDLENAHYIITRAKILILLVTTRLVIVF